MFFQRRRWALRGIEEMALPVRSPEATLLIDLLIWSAKVEADMLKVAGESQMPKPSGILMGGITMIHNATAVAKVARDLHLTEQAATQLLMRLKIASRQLAVSNGFEQIVDLADRV